MTEAQIIYHHRDDTGNIEETSRPIPFCCLCYNSMIHDRDPSFIQKDLDSQLTPNKLGKGGTITELAQITGMLVDALVLNVPGANITNPFLSCPLDQSDEGARKYKNQSSHLECATHYSLGLTLMAAERECRTLVAKQIAEQGIQGEVHVYLMDDFNFDAREWRVAAKYMGNSIDLYTLRLTQDGKKEVDFVEAKDDETIEHKIQDFFG